MPFLEVDYHVGRDGRVEVETRFSIPVDGDRIQRGPVLDYLTAFEGPGGLILNNRMEVLSLERNGEAEPFHTRDYQGILRIYCGDEETLLDHGLHEYRLRHRALGPWTYRDGLALAAFDVTEPFQGWVLREARVRLRLPEGVALEQYTPAVSGFGGTGLGYRAEEDARGVVVETVGPLGERNLFLLNAVWRSEGFVGKSRWLQVIQQHPRLPISAGVAAILVVLLCTVLSGGLARSRRAR